jgi:hypothetical protein
MIGRQKDFIGDMSQARQGALHERLAQEIHQPLINAHSTGLTPSLNHKAKFDIVGRHGLDYNKSYELQGQMRICR